MSNEFFNQYYDYSNPGSFSGISGFLKNNKKYSKKAVQKFLSGSETYTFHKKALNNFKRAKFKADFIDHVWQVDLLDFRNLKKKICTMVWIHICLYRCI